MTPAEIEATWTAEQAQFGIGDSDSDGMPDWYELRYASFLDPNDAADAALDEDSDASTNLNEYNIGTIPDDPDTDDDGVQDGPETNTGTWVSSSDTGTDPLDADTDNDGLLDGAETNTGTYVNPSNAGTDPFNTDTDADKWLRRTLYIGGSSTKPAWPQTLKTTARTRTTGACTTPA